MTARLLLCTALCALMAVVLCSTSTSASSADELALDLPLLHTASDVGVSSFDVQQRGNFCRRGEIPFYPSPAGRALLHRHWLAPRVRFFPDYVCVHRRDANDMRRFLSHHDRPDRWRHDRREEWEDERSRVTAPVVVVEKPVPVQPTTGWIESPFAVLHPRPTRRPLEASTSELESDQSIFGIVDSDAESTDDLFALIAGVSEDSFDVDAADAADSTDSGDFSISQRNRGRRGGGGVGRRGVVPGGRRGGNVFPGRRGGNVYPGRRGRRGGNIYPGRRGGNVYPGRRGGGNIYPGRDWSRRGYDRDYWYRRRGRFPRWYPDWYTPPEIVPIDVEPEVVVIQPEEPEVIVDPTVITPLQPVFPDQPNVNVDVDVDIEPQARVGQPIIMSAGLFASSDADSNVDSDSLTSLDSLSMDFETSQWGRRGRRGGGGRWPIDPRGFIEPFLPQQPYYDPYYDPYQQNPYDPYLSAQPVISPQPTLLQQPVHQEPSEPVMDTIDTPELTQEDLAEQSNNDSTNITIKNDSTSSDSDQNDQHAPAP